MKLPKEERILQVDGGITGTIQFSNSTSTLPIPSRSSDKELVRAETLRSASEQNPDFQVS